MSARATPDPTLPTSAFYRDVNANMTHTEEAPSSTFVRGHQRSRSQGLKSSTDSASSPRTRDRAKQPSQKAMLSKALQKANTAVQLDNAQNIDGARTAYCEACDLLQQVLQRTPGDDDKRKLEAIVTQRLYMTVRDPRQRRRHRLPTTITLGSPLTELSDQNRLAPDLSSQRGHQRTNSHESISWLDPIDESGGSSASSVHSRSSSIGVRRKHIRAVSGDTEAEFDAALDDAIEAAYDDGYEPVPPAEQPRQVNLDHIIDEDDVVAQALRKVQLAKERVRQSEMEMQRLASDRDQRMRALQEEEEQTLPEGFYDGSDSDDDEERILEKMTDGYAIEDFALVGQQSSKPRIPRESDSSEQASRTWKSSATSNPPTAANTTLSTVSENAPVPSLFKNQGPIAPPPTQSLPKLPPQRPASGGRDSVRDRRLSGQNAKQLKIETQQLGPKIREPATAGPMLQHPELPLNTMQPQTAGLITQQRQTLMAAPSRSISSHRGPSPIPSGISIEAAPPTPPVPTGFQDSDSRSGSSSNASKPPTLRKNFSSSSLKNMKTRKLSVSNMDEYSDISPGTPISNPFNSVSAARLPAMPSLPTPVATAFRDRMTSAAGGYHLFDADIHTPRSPTERPSVTSDGAPVPLEPCPKETMLRPFWLMRALYQTLCHPKGGYVSNKLFVPRDAWRTKGVKIKNLEEKISQCDLLTAALQKLDRVNTDDADAVLEEMQSLEAVLEQVQTFLTRRLGNDVGVQAAGAMFKDADGAMDGQDGKAIPRNNSVSQKGAFSWKRLRSKTSSTTISNSYQGGTGRKESGAAEALLATLPFTDYPTSKPSKRDVKAVQFSGPNAHYMAALAKLFDAAQCIDQIARQVEDPGLRHQDKTQVGLELSTRHAAEFFAFYVCRFVLQDLTMLLDKFIKRGSEWVLV
ncbi:hypothetical protein M406DRAFT_283106 [Cryphonectria parasitica EP155]|uniref:MIT domain-containing protein n=1 Tax=Cryphonectria parasitica (strain ATCC 38755 / EP155) TaxID=660469 RepID=A0A9P4XUU8_CRYP1|nr:uncharacterized protein M406DRAFT_283106 [Cryphonectria parasitica EP155]KAF3761155.1 hypothetical protein M406DRAFT_283106 [Cryphonectria parasitica EP155]